MKAIFHFLSLLLIVSLSVILPHSAFCESVTQIRIGVSIPLTGDASTYGNDYKNIYSFANEELAQGRYKLIFEDDRCLGRDGVSIANKFAHIDKVRFVLGVSCDGVFSSAAPIYQKNRIVVISTSASTVEGDPLFHSALSKKAWVMPLVEHLRASKELIGVYSEETGFAQEFAQNFVDASSKLGLKTVSNVFASDSSDFSAPLFLFKSQGVTRLLLVTQAEASLVRLVEQAARIKLAIPLYNAFAAGSPSFLKIVGPKANGITFVDFPSLADSLTTEGAAVHERFRHKYGNLSSSEGVFTLAFEGFRAMHAAIQAKENPAEFLQKASFSGITGSWRFAEGGFWVGPKMVVKHIVNERVVSLASKDNL